MSKKIFLMKFGRCAWHKCLFCGYGRMEGKKSSIENVRREFDSFFDKLEPGVDHITVFGSGSFLDEKQIPLEGRRYFIQKCKESKIKKLTIESRPEFIKAEALKEFEGIELEVAIGLEIADDRTLDKINKGFHLRDFEKASKLLHSYNIRVRTYLLVNLPFVENIKKSLDNSVEYALKFSDSIVLINLLPHYRSKLMELWLRGEWNFLSRDEFYRIVDKWNKDSKIELDAETFWFTPKFPPELREDLSGVGEEFLTHSYFEVWQDYLLRWYEVPKDKEILLFLPCSHRKPYSESETHRKIIKILNELNLRGKIHEVMLSNAGLVPRGFENLYPFNAYDWDEKLETEEIKQRYIEVTSKRIENYLKAHRYKGVLCFLKYDSESYKALKIACNKLNLEFRNLLKEKTYKEIRKLKKPMQTEDALKDLYDGLKDEESIGILRNYVKLE